MRQRLSVHKCIVRCIASVAFLAAVGLAIGQDRLYWGDVHGHTALSDGKGSLDAYFTYARDVAKLDFVIVTDHDFGNGPPWRMPDSDWTMIQEKADAYTVAGRFVAIAGYEWTSQPKYWTDVGPGQPSERLFPGPPKYYNHKNVYFPTKGNFLFRAKEAAYRTPDLLAAAVTRVGGLMHHCHPAPGQEGLDQWECEPRFDAVITNTEIGNDTIWYKGKRYEPKTEQTVRNFLNTGRRVGFVGGSDTHDGKPLARTAVLAKELTREAIFDSLRHRRNYAISNARIEIDFKIEGRLLGSEVEANAPPLIVANVSAPGQIVNFALVRDGIEIASHSPRSTQACWKFRDDGFRRQSCYYLRVVESTRDSHGNESLAWTSPIWVRAKRVQPRSGR